MKTQADAGAVVELRPGRTSARPVSQGPPAQGSPGQGSSGQGSSGQGPVASETFRKYSELHSRARDWFTEAHQVLGDVENGTADVETLEAKPSFSELSLDFQPDSRALWVYQQHRTALGYTPALLEDILSFHNHFRQISTTLQEKIRFLIWGSRHPDVFNLGGDLALFCELIRKGDRNRLQKYAHDCIHACYGHAINHGLPIISIAMVQGDALGGGLESVLSSDVIIAERGARFGFPEILFGLFPAMGAYSFISRRIGGAEAEKMILSGKTYGADEMCEMGLFDEVVDNGEGPAAVQRYIEESQRKFAGLMSVYAARRRVNPVTLDEMMDIVDMWVDAALTLDASMMRRMELLVRAQQRQLKSSAAGQEMAETSSVTALPA